MIRWRYLLFLGFLFLASILIGLFAHTAMVTGVSDMRKMVSAVMKRTWDTYVPNQQLSNYTSFATETSFDKNVTNSSDFSSFFYPNDRTRNGVEDPQSRPSVDASSTPATATINDIQVFTESKENSTKLQTEAEVELKISIPTSSPQTQTPDPNIHLYTLSHFQRNVTFPPLETIVLASMMDGSDGLVPWPIGMGDVVKDYNRSGDSFWYHIQADKYTKTTLLMSSMGALNDLKRRDIPHSEKRRSIIDLMNSRGFELENIRYNNRTEYYRTLGHAKFVLSPEGNGIDCHRHYEAIFMGTIPIVSARNKAIIEMKYGKNAPILWTKDYKDITKEYLERVYADMLEKTFDYSRMFVSTYDPGLQYWIKTFSHHWTQKFSHRVWFTDHKEKPLPDGGEKYDMLTKFKREQWTLLNELKQRNYAKSRTFISSSVTQTTTTQVKSTLNAENEI